LSLEKKSHPKTQKQAIRAKTHSKNAINTHSNQNRTLKTHKNIK
jgi:hypothetical protein